MSKYDARFFCPKCKTLGNCDGPGEQDAGLCHCPNCDNDWTWSQEVFDQASRERAAAEIADRRSKHQRHVKLTITQVIALMMIGLGLGIAIGGKMGRSEGRAQLMQELRK